MALEEKASKWVGFIIKGMAFFAVLGCITLCIAVYFINKSFSDITKAPDQVAPGQSAGTSTAGRHP
jgi:hypothetical protein